MITFSSRLLKKLKIEARLDMAFKHCISFTTYLAANFD